MATSSAWSSGYPSLTGSSQAWGEPGAALALADVMSETSVELSVERSLQQAKLTPAEQFALAEFVDRTKKRIWSASARYCRGNRELAEEAFQETYLLAARKWRDEVQHFDPGRQDGWLFTSLAFITRKLYIKQRDRRDSPTDDITVLDAALTRNTGQRQLDEVVADRETLGEVLGLAARHLNKWEYAVLVMTCIDDRARADVASILDRDEGTVGSDLSRARKKLRDLPAMQALMDRPREGR